MMLRRGAAGMVARVAMAAVAVVMVAGCDEKKTEPVKKEDAKKEDKKDATSAKLEAAMAAAASAGARSKGPAQAQADGPPPAGVFAPGAADKVMARGAPVKVEMMSDGAEPRVALVSSSASWKGGATVGVAMRLGQRNALPTLDFSVSLGPDKKKDDKGAAGAPAAPSALVLLGDVTAVKLGAEQPGRLPDGTQKEVAKLKGSQLRWASDDLGIAREPSSVVSKEGQADLQRSLDAAAEALFYLSVPPPPKPVGVGASWIAGSRQVIGNVEVISYRLYKVASVGPDGMQLTLESHEYAVSDALDMGGLPRGSALSQYEAVAQGELTLPPREALASKGKVVRQASIGVQPPGGAQPQQPQGGMMGVQFVSESTVVRGK